MEGFLVKCCFLSIIKGGFATGNAGRRSGVNKGAVVMRSMFSDRMSYVNAEKIRNGRVLPEGDLVGTVYKTFIEMRGKTGIDMRVAKIKHFIMKTYQIPTRSTDSTVLVSL
ncbi:hypothetical protein L596_005574 [Steinernema carpocapsae]|uniref:Uncharacterized protein n=1 Tax=Steinernema carpocapsae TaxID=34508 RepID=A0A4U8UZF4_STECR|nr:hypothetical protein L596_005574 [Steinernema carpocapsae]